MKLYRYEAKRDSNIIRGILYAKSKVEATSKITEMGLEEIKLLEEHPGLLELEGSSLKDFWPKKIGRLKRVPCRAPIFFRTLEYRGPLPETAKVQEKICKIQLQGMIENIGPGGVFFMISTRDLFKNELFASSENATLIDVILEPGNLLELETRLSGQEEAVLCVGKVLRLVKEIESEEIDGVLRFYAAVMFTKMSLLDRERLLAFHSSWSSGNETV